MAEVTTSGKVIQKPEIVLGVDDFLPPGLIGVSTTGRDDISVGDTIGSESAGTIQEIEEESDEGSRPPTSVDFDQLPIPTTMRIISQVFQVGPDGKMTVDVVIETDDFSGIQEFEARVVRDS